jgi:DNA modification methylase
MSYLVNLIAPPITDTYKPVILDCFMGTGTTGIAALLNGYDFIGIELSEDYMKIAQARINNSEEFRKL